MTFDVLVVGAGHAGVEAAHAAVRMGACVCLVTANLDRIAVMSCNPAIGGLAKGQLVKEVDALGGEMGKAIDETGIQFRRLNTRKGPAVWSSRAQADRHLYSARMKDLVESTKGFHVKQGLVEGLSIKDGQCLGVQTALGEELRAGATILTTGTFLGGKIFIGTHSQAAGRLGDETAEKLSLTLASLGLPLRRLKTGTVPRLDGKTINFKNLEEQWGDQPPPTFSFFHPSKRLEEVPCFITHTNEKTHEIIRENLSRSALYGGKIQGAGPRYCPSIEDKIVRFFEKAQHQVFLEPEGLRTQEYYPNGLSNSLPWKVQVEFLRSIPGLEEAEVMRPGYAVEYDFVEPMALHAWLETKKINRLFLAGQINGTTGYEEAAAQGLMAGVNAVLALTKKDPFVLGRAEAYTGVLIDDLVTKGTNEPYRMFTSRAEHRLVLREDNADQRLTEHAWKLGLISSSVYQAYRKKIDAIEETVKKIQDRRLRPTAKTQAHLKRLNLAEIRKTTTLKELLRRPEVDWKILETFIPELSLIDPAVAEQVSIGVKYQGYIEREEKEIARAQKDEAEEIPASFDFASVPSLSHEVREKLCHVRPRTLGQASRISGVTPAAVSVLAVFLKRHQAVGEGISACN